MSLLHLAPKIVAGSALAGFGLAFGRDVYRKTKKNLILVIILAVLAFTLYGLFISAVWVARNYRTWSGSIVKRFGALVAFVSCNAATAFIVLFLAVSVANVGVPDGDQVSKEVVSAFDLPISKVGLAVQVVIVISGLIVGFFQRRRRRIAWEAERNNELFFAEHGFESLDEDNFRDDQGNRFRLLNVFDGELEFMAEGRRGKRGYIEFDENGAYTNWSGLTNIR